MFRVLRGSQLLTYEAMSIVIGHCDISYWWTFIVLKSGCYMACDCTHLWKFYKSFGRKFFVVRTYGRKILKPIFDGKAMKQQYMSWSVCACRDFYKYSNVDVLLSQNL